MSDALCKRIAESKFSDQRIEEMRKELADYYEMTFGVECRNQFGKNFDIGDKVANLSAKTVEAQHA
jgi:hypothetical protein